LFRAEHRRYGRIKARGLFESAAALAEAGEFPRAPAASATRRKKRDMGVFFWLLFFSRERKVTSGQASQQNSPFGALHYRPTAKINVRNIILITLLPGSLYKAFTNIAANSSSVSSTGLPFMLLAWRALDTASSV
jgi:hypothetical protein